LTQNTLTPTNLLNSNAHKFAHFNAHTLQKIVNKLQEIVNRNADISKTNADISETIKIEN